MTPEAIEERFKALNVTINSVEKTLMNRLDILIRLEERHENTAKSLERAFLSIDSLRGETRLGAEAWHAESEKNLSALDERLSRVEIDMPGLKELRRWVIGGVAVAATTLMGSMISLDRSNAKQQEFLQQLLLSKPPAAERIPLTSK